MDKMTNVDKWAIYSRLLDELFPFTFSFDKKMHLLHVGRSLLKIQPKLAKERELEKLISLSKPRLPMQYEELSLRTGAIFTWELLDKCMLKGQIIRTPDLDTISFIGTPIINDAAELVKLGLTADDFPAHDNTLEHLFLLQSQQANVRDSSKMVQKLRKTIEDKSNLERIKDEISKDLNIAHDMLLRFDERGLILASQISGSLSKLVAIDNLVGKSVYADIPFLGADLQTVVDSLESKQNTVFNFQVEADQKQRYFESRLVKTSAKRFLMLSSDITEQKEMQLQLERRANYDNLTSLPNRFHFIEKIGVIAEKVRSGRGVCAIAIIDLDDFKNVNDLYGFEAGDAVLQHVALLHQDEVGGKDVVARFSGNEFIVFFSEYETESRVTDILDKIRAAILEGAHIQGNSIRLECSIGVAFTASSELNTEELRAQASLAMEKAKKEGKRKIVHYLPGMAEEHHERAILKEKLMKAIDTRALSVVFQPVVTSSTGAIKGFEALARWSLPNGETVPPDTFIRIAEEGGLMVPLGAALLDITVSTWSEILRAYPQLAGATLSLNISPHQMYDNTFIEDLCNCLDNYHIAHSQILVEITETAFIGDIEAAVDVLTELKRNGFTIALDDFGTGYSSLAYLEQLPIDILKIDRAFISKITAATRKIPVVNTIIEVAKALNLQLVAEGVEEKTQVTFLQEKGCHYCQGYYYSKPLTMAEFSSLPETLLFID